MTEDMHAKCCSDINKFSKADHDLVTSMLKTYRLVLSKPDTRLVACTDPKELETVKKNFLQKKLGLTDSDSALDALLEKVCQKMKDSRQKNRLTFYYLLVEETGKQDVFS